MSIDKIQPLTVDIIDDNNLVETNTRRTFYSQDKETAIIKFQVRENGKEFDFSTLTDATASVAVRTADRSLFNLSATITNSTSGVVEVVIPQEVLLHEGKAEGELYIDSGGKRNATVQFSFKIKLSLIDKDNLDVPVVIETLDAVVKSVMLENPTSFRGIDNYELWLQNGNTGTYDEYLSTLSGQDGKSAYQIWLDAGNAGTEQDFLESQKGADGQDANPEDVAPLVLPLIQPELDKKFIGLEVNVAEHGVLPDGNDYTIKMQELANTYESLVIPAGEYNITDQLTFHHGQSIRCVGSVTFNGTNFVGTSGNAVLKVKNEGENYSTLPSLSSNITKGTINLTFSSDHNLMPGDIICLYDKTDGSYNSSRAYYRKGEFCKVASVIDNTTVLLDATIFDDYTVVDNVNFGVYKMNMGTFNIFGDLSVIQGKQGNYISSVFERVKDFTANNFKAFAKNGSYTALQFVQCFNTDFKGTAIHEKLSGLGGDYGVAFLNCQHLKADGYFAASRHGVTHGGYDGIGGIVNRDCHTRGTVKSSGGNYAAAWNCHGNVEHVSFDGIAYGGITVAGKNTVVRGFTTSTGQGMAVVFAEICGFNHNLSGLRIESKNPLTVAGRGVIDFGGAGTMDMDKMEGGMIDFSNVVMNAPLADYGIVLRLRNPNNEESINQNKFDVKLDGMIADINPLSTKPSILFTSLINKNLRNVTTLNMRFNVKLFSIIKVDNLQLPSKRGETTYTTDTTTGTLTTTITFPEPFPSGYTPFIQATTDKSAIGKNIVCKVANFTNTKFDVVIHTVDGSNFSIATTGKIVWKAE